MKNTHEKTKQTNATRNKTNQSQSIEKAMSIEKRTKKQFKQIKPQTHQTKTNK